MIKYKKLSVKIKQFIVKVLKCLLILTRTSQNKKEKTLLSKMKALRN